MARFLLPLLLAFVLVGCSHGRKRVEGAADTAQCRDFCQKLERCVGSEYSDELKSKLCELARCESGCRARVRAEAGYEGAFQFDRKTWRGNCGPIFERLDRDQCRDLDSRNDLCCAAICTAELISQGGIRRWPTCGN